MPKAFLEKAPKIAAEERKRFKPTAHFFTPTYALLFPKR
jgi:hypothetical protein